MSRKQHVITSFSFPQEQEEIVQKFQALIKREGCRSLSQGILQAMRDYLKAHGQGNPAVPLDRFFEDPSYQAVPTLITMNGHDWGQYDDLDLARWDKTLRREDYRIRQVQDQRRKQQQDQDLVAVVEKWQREGRPIPEKTLARYEAIKRTSGR